MRVQRGSWQTLDTVPEGDQHLGCGSSEALQTEPLLYSAGWGDCYTVLLWFRQAHIHEAKPLSLQCFVLPFQDQFRRAL